jgi:DnaJ-class molecular chaperone
MTRGAGGGPAGADIFNQFFGGGGGGGGGGFNFGFDFGPGRRPGRGEDSVIPYEVTLEDLYNGKTVKMDMEKEVVCGTCKGYGCQDPFYPLWLITQPSGRAEREGQRQRSARSAKEMAFKWLGSP